MIDDLHKQYGERLKNLMMANYGLDYLAASAVVVNTFAQCREFDLAAYAKTYPVFPKLFSIAMASQRRAA